MPNSGREARVMFVTTITDPNNFNGDFQKVAFSEEGTAHEWGRIRCRNLTQQMLDAGGSPSFTFTVEEIPVLL
jgi:hypothetical protein